MKVTTILIQKKNDIYLFTIRPNKKCVFTVTCQKNLGSVGIKKKLLSTKPEIVVPGFGIRYFIFEISGKPSFVKAVL